MSHSTVADFVSSLKDVLFHHDHGSVQKFIESIRSCHGSVNTLNLGGDSILHSIVKRQYANHRKKMELKLKYLNGLLMYSDIDVNLPNEQKATALHIAVEVGDTEAVKALLVFGANVNALDGNNKTPLDLMVGPYRFLSRQESSGFTLIDVEDTDNVSTATKRPSVKTSPSPRPRPPLKSQLSFTDEEVPAPSRQPASRMHSAFTSFTSTFAKSGNVGGMAKLLMDHGGERGNKVASTSQGDTKQHRLYIVQQFQDMITTECSESVSIPNKANKAECVVDDDWTAKIATLNYQISFNIERKLLDITNPLSRHPDEAMAVGIQMKELKMLRDAGSRMLFLDGGGMRGLIQIEILSQLEEQTGRRITELFDWIVGTSTGGIIALALVYGKRSLRELRQFYFKIKDEVFHSGRFGLGYNTGKMEEVVRKEFGDMKMNEISHPRVIITAVNKSTINLKLTIFNNCFGDEFSTQPVWKVARYTTGGPIYFSALDDYVDGGILANNPCSSGLTRIQDHYRNRRQKLPISLIVSVGSGVLPENELGSVDAHEFLYLGKHWFDFKEHLSGRAKNLTTLLGNAVGESESIAHNVASRCKEQGVDYYRFSPQLTKVIPAGETDLDTLYEMILLAKNSITVSKDSVEFRKLIWRFHCCSNANQKMRTRLLQKTT